MRTSKGWAFLSSPTCIVLIAVLIGAISWLHSPRGPQQDLETRQIKAEFHEYELAQPGATVAYVRDESPERPPHKKRRHRHGPPPPPFPPTVLFLIGGALGYLIGQRRGRPPFPRHCDCRAEKNSSA